MPRGLETRSRFSTHAIFGPDRARVQWSRGRERPMASLLLNETAGEGGAQFRAREFANLRANVRPILRRHLGFA